jgi:hypothetical protein
MTRYRVEVAKYPESCFVKCCEAIDEKDAHKIAETLAPSVEEVRIIKVVTEETQIRRYMDNNAIRKSSGQMVCSPRLVRIRRGCVIWQDFANRGWPQSGEDVDLAFEATLSNERRKRWKLVADGYGSFKDGESYGSGAIYAKESQLHFLSANAKAHSSTERK